MQHGEDLAARPDGGADVEAAEPANVEEGEGLLNHEDMLYALNLAFREFVDLMRNYDFGDFDRLSLNVSDAGVPWILKRDQLELFRRRQVDMAGLLSFTKI